MGYVGHWFHEHHMAPSNFHLEWTEVVDFLKTSWLTLILVVLGVMAIVSAVLIAWPVLAHLAARFF